MGVAPFPSDRKPGASPLRFLAGLFLACTPLVGAAAGGNANPWATGPYLMLDDTLMVKQEGVSRRVNHPSTLPAPIVTGYEDGCFQPYVTVIRDWQTRRFRMWYGVPAIPGNADQSRLACIESDDGIHWTRPHRLCETPPIQFGASVLDESPDFADAGKRYKFAWWKNGGLQVAASPDGLKWAPLAPGVVVASNHDITGIDWDPVRKRYIAFLSRYDTETEGPYKGLRIPHQSVSDDLVHWKQPWRIVTPDPTAAIEKGETQFYGMSAMLARGSLLVSLVKVLRDDLNCEPDKTAAELHDTRRYAGLGYTVLAWSHDGEHWQRDTEPFLNRNAQPGTWDRAMAWADDQMIVGDYTYIYYGGYRWGHKAERFTDRQIGFAHMLRDRYVGLTAEANGGFLVTRKAVCRASRVTVNARVHPTSGELRMRVLDDSGRPCADMGWDDCAPIRGDRVDHPIVWKRKLDTLLDKPVQFEIRLRNATLYSFDLQ